MGSEATLPDELAAEVRELVRAGEYPTFQDAVEGLVREALRKRRGSGPPDPRDLPPSERPTDVDADDVNWF
jgi:Arc/MetJ-type ribon-helix-helix transcriptional regulator